MKKLFCFIFLFIFIGKVEAQPVNPNFDDDNFYDCIIMNLNEDEINGINNRDSKTYVATDEELSKMPTLACVSYNINSVKDALNVAGIKYEVLGDGTKVINQYPLSGTIVNGRVFIMTNSNNISVPNIKGYSRKDAINLAKVLGVEYSLEGNGYVNDYAVELDSNGKVTKINMKLTDKYVEN